MIDEKKLIEWAELIRDDYVKIFLDFHSAGVVQYIIDGIKEQPKIGQWIPCSERLPEEGESVLISTKTSDRVYVGTYTKRYGFERREGFICADGFMWLNTAIAWMPLPPAFVEGDKE